MSAAIVTEESHAKVNFSALAFYSEYAGVYRDMWTVLGRTWTTLAAESVWARETIPGKEHGLLKIELTNDQRTALMPLLRTMQFFRGLKLAGGVYDELSITGAKFRAMRERTGVINHRLIVEDPKQKVSFDRIVFQIGHRPRMDYDGSVEEIYASLTNAVKSHPWVIEQMQLMQQPDPLEMWNGAFATEYNLGILAFIIATDGNIQVESFEPCSDEADLPGIPPRTTASCTLRLPDGTPVIALNGPAVKRPHGDPRPTTISNTNYWLDHYTPKRGGKIVTVSGKTHWYRVIGDFERQLHQRFPDITVFGMSSGAASTDEAYAVLNNALAEAVWLLQKAYEEVIGCLS